MWPRSWHEDVFRRDGVLDLIDGAVYSSEIDWTKPHPEAFLAAMAAVGVTDPERCVFVGDRPWDDIHGAQSVGMRAVLIPHSDVPTFADATPDAVIDEPVRAAPADRVLVTAGCAARPASSAAPGAGAVRIDVALRWRAPQPESLSQCSAIVECLAAHRNTPWPSSMSPRPPGREDHAPDLADPAVRRRGQPGQLGQVPGQPAGVLGLARPAALRQAGLGDQRQRAVGQRPRAARPAPQARPPARARAPA